MDVKATVESAVLEAAQAVVTPEHVAMVEALVEGFITKAVVDAIAANVPMPFVASMLAKLVTDERVHTLLKAAEGKVVELARAQLTASPFAEQLVDVVAKAEGV